ncbi:flagellar hook-basal body protein [Lachnospiraceae bacterium 56-18]|jgi:flagellar basal-body rod protein FlgG
MYTSFYTAARGAMEEQEKLNVVGHNLANANNYGYKAKTTVFTDLMYYNLNNYTGEDTRYKAGAGINVEKTNTDFSPKGLITTEEKFDYAINGKGFFMLRSPITNEITYTRNGHFSMSRRGNEFYLVNDNGNFVLDENRNPIRVLDGNAGELSGQIGVYGFNILDGMQSTGNNEFVPVLKNGEPFLMRDAKLIDHALEMSGVDVADDFTRMIEAQRAYSYALKMVQTSDEVVNTINTLRA